MTTFDTEIRKLQPIELCTLAQILNQSDSWKKLMAIIPKDVNDNEYLFNNEHFIMIEQATRQQQRSAADIFLSEWSTMNKIRPTCRSMLDLLIRAELFRAADYLAVDVLKSYTIQIRFDKPRIGNPPERPKTGPAAPIDISDDALEKLLREKMKNLKTKCDQPEDTKESWSLHYAEKAVDVTGNRAEKTEVNKIDSDLIKFSVSDDKIVRNSSQPISDLIKFSNIDADNYLVENYGLQEARSEDIPLCVRENLFQSNKTASSLIENSESSTSIESSDEKNTITSDQVDLPIVSQNIIPLVVLQYNENKYDT